MKKTTFIPLLISALFSTSVIADNDARVHRYKVIDLGTLGGESFAYAINESGVVVGASYDAARADVTLDDNGLPPGTQPKKRNMRPFLFIDGKMRDISSFAILGGTTEINHDLVAGGVLDENGFSKAAVYDIDKNRITLLGGLTDQIKFGAASGLNEEKQVVGTLSADATDITDQTDATSVNTHAFLYNKGVMRDLGSFGGGSQALAINEEGAIVGSSSNASGKFHAFLYKNGIMKDIDPSGDVAFTSGAMSMATSINEEGQVIGFFADSVEENGVAKDVSYSFIYHDGKFIKIQSPTLNLFASSINEHGVVVGTSGTPIKGDTKVNCDSKGLCNRSNNSAFVYVSGKAYDLNKLVTNITGWELLDASDINSHNEIVGTGKHNGQFRAFKLVPLDHEDGNGGNGNQDSKGNGARRGVKA